MQEMSVAAVGLDAVTSTPVVLLEELAPRHRVLPVWMGPAEAEAIEIERQRLQLPRPAAHQLIASVIDFSGRRLERVCVTAIRNGVVHAELVIDQDTRVSARASDAVAVALHVGVPIMVDDAVLAEAGLDGARMIDVGPPDRTGDLRDDPVAVLEMRDFLERATPEDFA